MQAVCRDKFLIIYIIVQPKKIYDNGNILRNHRLKRIFISKRYEVIKSLSDEYTVNILCEALKVAKGSYYNHILRNKNGNTKAANRKAEMLPVIEQIFHDYNEIFGSSKIFAILKDRGYAISESTVAKIMHENGMFSIRACAKTLYKQHQERKANILQQQFQVSRPNEVWVSDVTYFSVFGRMYYICVVLDLYARKVIAYKISRHNSTQLTKSTVKAAYGISPYGTLNMK